MAAVEQWWNGTWGRLVRRDVLLNVDDGRWSLTVRWWGHEGDFDYASEADARKQLELLLDPAYGDWRRID